MDLLIFAIVIIAVVALIVWAIRSAPIPPTPSWILQVAVMVLGAIVILLKAGLIPK